MFEKTSKWIRKTSNMFIHSIAFFPAMISFLFLGIGMLALEMDQRGFGQSLYQRFKWLTLKDPSTARTTLATVAAALISVTVFSFSMVMIVMTQAASQMSNRMLDNIIGDKTQKVVLGFYIGTIVYSLFLLSNISETTNEASVPSFGVYLALAMTILDMFLFVYFIHRVTQLVKYEQLIKKIHERTKTSFEKWYVIPKMVEAEMPSDVHVLLSPKSGYFQKFSYQRLMKTCEENGVTINFCCRPGTYILKGAPFFSITGRDMPADESLIKKLLSDIDFYYGQQIDENPYYGYQHLMEVAVKALSPGINDPGTAVLCINALSDLLVLFASTPNHNAFIDAAGKVRIVLPTLTFDQLFDSSILPIWDYGKKDRNIQAAMIQMVSGIKSVGHYENSLDRLCSFENECRRQLL